MKYAPNPIPPLVAPANKQKLTATEHNIPPKIAERRMSSVTLKVGKISVKSPESKIIKQE